MTLYRFYNNTLPASWRKAILSRRRRMHVYDYIRLPLWRRSEHMTLFCVRVLIFDLSVNFRNNWMGRSIWTKLGAHVQVSKSYLRELSSNARERNKERQKSAKKLVFWSSHRSYSPVNFFIRKCCAKNEAEFSEVIFWPCYRVNLVVISCRAVEIAWPIVYVRDYSL